MAEITSLMKDIKGILTKRSNIEYDIEYLRKDINNIDELNKWLEIKANVLIGDI